MFVVRGGELLAVELIRRIVDEYFVYRDGIAREKILAVGNAESRECNTLCRAALSEVKADCIGARAGYQRVLLLDPLGLVGGVVAVANAVGLGVVRTLIHYPRDSRVVGGEKLYLCVCFLLGFLGGLFNFSLSRGLYLVNGLTGFIRNCARAEKFRKLFVGKRVGYALVEIAAIPENGAEVVEVAVVEQVVVESVCVRLYPAILQHDCILADDHAVALVGEFAELFKKPVLLAVVLRGTPLINAVSAAVVPRGVVMHGEQKLVFSAVLGHLEAVVAGLGDIGVVARDEQESVLIIAAEGADYLHELAVYLVGGLVALVFVEHAARACYVLVVEAIAQLLVC